MAEIMFDDQKTRVVLLNRSFGNDGRNMKELRSRFTKDGAMFSQFLQNEAPLDYGLSAAEADAFAETWLAYRTEQKAKEQAEEARKQAVIAEAYAIVEKHPAIEIRTIDGRDEDGNTVRAWIVSVPSQGWNCGMYTQWSYSAAQLLEHVKHARAALQGREDTKATA